MVTSAQTWFKLCAMSMTPCWSLFYSVSISKVRVASMSCPLRLVCVGHLAEFALIFVTEHSEPPDKGKWKERIMEGGKRRGREGVGK